MSLYKKTPHPSRFARHLLPLSRRRRPRSLARIGQFPAGEGFLSAFSFAYAGAKEKAIKRKRQCEILRSAERDKSYAFTPSRRRRHTCFTYVLIPLMAPPPQKACENFDGGEIQFGKNKSVAFCKGNAFLLLLLLLLFLCVLLRAQPRFFLKI